MVGNRLGLVVVAVLWLTSAAGLQGGKGKELKVGDPAPEVTFLDLTGKTAVPLSSLRGKPLVLIFGSRT
ncbi:MAG: hypothetical protein RMK62_12305 [Armatimonadota bacterium]|nr:hypothetical protein [Armatimonadota bacterium]